MNNKQHIEEKIDELTLELVMIDSSKTEEIEKKISLIQMYKSLLKEEKSKSIWSKIDINVLLTLGFSVLEILIMLHYEQAHVLTSKVFGRLIKPKI